MLSPIPTALGVRVDMAIPGIVGFADPSRDVTPVAPSLVFTVPLDDLAVSVPPDDMAASVPLDDCVVVVPPDDASVAVRAAGGGLTVDREGLFALKSRRPKTVPRRRGILRVTGKTEFDAGDC